MFTIIGGDGREYGPVTADQVRAWMTAGRANLDTQARQEGAEGWRRLGDYAEFIPEPVLPAEMPPLPGERTAMAGDEGFYESSGAEAPLAGRGTRLAAALLDNLAAFVFALPGMCLIGLRIVTEIFTGQFKLEEFDFAQAGAGSALLMFGMMVLLAIQFSMVAQRGQTIGKRIMGVRIVRAPDESNAGFGRAVVLRSLLPALVSAVPYVGFFFSMTDIFFIFRDDRRCVHDLIAGTKVIQVEEEEKVEKRES